ncbi:helix-turn-helix transcriptional regulator [Kineococcus sp. SYSU DK002]|uniref:helix-turn-helix transcriptional regulator n=1 Tax=Kineococcus sp. SYSU DK002 TaxID=3383123 RepID=UPI003D7D4DA4
MTEARALPPGPVLGRFLTARRGTLDPADVDLPSTGLRRVPGLRREEVAVLAGLSADYYTRLEQGRESHPSAQVVDAVAGALRLEPDEREHLHRLAGTTPARPTTRATINVDPGLRLLTEQWPTTPASVYSRTLDVLARNQLAAALYVGFAETGNLARATFLDPESERFYDDWSRAADAAVANLRAAESYPEDRPRLEELVEELAAGSREFRIRWKAHKVRAKTREAKVFHHPQVGTLELSYQAFEVAGAAGQQLIVQYAAPATPSYNALRLLSSWSASALEL